MGIRLITGQTLREIRTLYTETNLSGVRIAIHYNMGMPKLRKLAKTHGWTRPAYGMGRADIAAQITSRPPPKMPERLSKAQLRKLTDVAYHNRKPRTGKHKLRLNPAVLPPEEDAARTRRDDWAALYARAKYMWEQGLEIEVIAKRQHVTVAAVRHRLRIARADMSIPRRTYRVPDNKAKGASTADRSKAVNWQRRT